MYVERGKILQASKGYFLELFGEVGNPKIARRDKFIIVTSSDPLLGELGSIYSQLLSLSFEPV